MRWHSGNLTARFSAAITASWLLCAAAQASGPVVPSRPDDTPARSTLLRLEHEWLNATDTKTLRRILAPDFLHPVAQGVVLNRRQHIAWVVAHPPDPGIARHLADVRIRIYGNAAVVTGRVVRARAGAKLPDSLFTDVFIKRAGAWRAVSAQETLASH